MDREYSLEEIAESVQEWCSEHWITPANGQAAEQLSERNIRYYRTIGLLDAPVGTYVKRFTEKHRLQLIGIRVLQAHGFPLRKIREQLHGKSIPELKRLQTRQVAIKPGNLSPVMEERWRVLPIDDDFLLISRKGTAVPLEQQQQIRRVLSGETVEEIYE